MFLARSKDNGAWPAQNAKHVVGILLFFFSATGSRKSPKGQKDRETLQHGKEPDSLGRGLCDGA